MNAERPVGIVGPERGPARPPGDLTEYVVELERRAAVAEAEGATAQVANVYRLVLAELAAVNGNGAPTPPPPNGADRLLTVQEAATRLGVPPGWLYRRAKTLPFTRKLGPKTLRFDPDGLARWVTRRSA